MEKCEKVKIAIQALKKNGKVVTEALVPVLNLIVNGSAVGPNDLIICQNELEAVYGQSLDEIADIYGSPPKQRKTEPKDTVEVPPAGENLQVVGGAQQAKPLLSQGSDGQQGSANLAQPQVQDSVGHQVGAAMANQQGQMVQGQGQIVQGQVQMVQGQMAHPSQQQYVRRYVQQTVQQQQQQPVQMQTAQQAAYRVYTDEAGNILNIPVEMIVSLLHFSVFTFYTALGLFANVCAFSHFSDVIVQSSNRYFYDTNFGVHAILILICFVAITFAVLGRFQLAI